MNIITELKARRNEAATRKAMRYLDNHILRDIGMPEREPNPFGVQFWTGKS